MRTYDTATADYLARRDGVAVRHCVWFKARNRVTGAQETLGIWNGDDVTETVIDGEPRTYIGAGAMLSLDPIQAGIGIDVRMLRARFAPMAPATVAALRQYDPRLAEVEIHRVFLDPVSGTAVAFPHRVFRGWVNAVSITEGPEAVAEVTFASAARALTRPLTLKRSDEAMRQRMATDAFRRWSDISGEVGVWWGESRSDPRPAAETSSTPAPSAGVTLPGGTGWDG